MLKVPTFLLGGLLILTGLAGYFLQDPGLSIKITGPLAGNAKLTLSDGNETHELNLVGVESSESNGERAYWIIWNLNTNHAINASQGNYAVDEGSDRYKKKSFWYASSKGETFDALMQDAKNYKNASVSNYEPVTVKWSKVDENSSTIKFVYKNETGNSGPATLQVSNWKNIDIEPKPKPNAKLEFKKSWTALIPGIIGLVLILLIMIAEAKPVARKHVMHAAVLFALFGFAMVAKRIGSAVSEMNWLKDEPNGIIQTSSLKPATMLISAGLLLIFIILCVVSFIQARKDMAAQAKKDEMSKKKSPEGKDEEKDEKKKDSSDSKVSKQKEEKKEDEKDKYAPVGSDKKDDSNKPKRPDGSGDPSKKSPKSPTKGLPIRKPVDSSGKKASFDLKSKKGLRTPEDTDDKKDGEEKKKEDDSDTETKKDFGKDDGVSREKSDVEKSGDSSERKDSDEQSDKDDPAPVMKESEETPEKKEEDTDTEPKKDSEEDTGFSYKKPDFEKSGDSDARKESDEQSDKDDPSPEIKESEETPEEKEDGTDPDPKKESGESEDSSDDRPEEK